MNAAQPAVPSLVEYGRRRTLIIIGVMLASILQVLDATIVNVALPTIQGNLGANLDEGTWIVTGYIIAAVIVIPLTPWLQQRFGRKQYYVAAIVGFTVTSALCGAARTFEQEVFFRVLQGLCGGGLIATGQAVLRDTFPPKDIGKSQVLVAIGAIVGPSVGPTLGGILTDNLSWNWVFYINIVPGAIAATLVTLYLRNPAPPQKLPVDVVGLALLATGLGSLQFVLNEGQRNDWFASATIDGFFGVGIAGLGAFVCWELFGARRPIVDLRILAKPTVWAGCLLAMALGFSLFGGIVLAPQFNQTILGFTATLSGESILVRALAILFFTPLTLVFINRFKVRPWILLAVGFAIVSFSSAIQANVTTSTADFWTFGLPFALGGVGFAQLLAPLSVAVLSSVQGADTPKASSLLSLSQQLGGSIATAVLVTLLARREAFHQTILAGHVTLHDPVLASIATQPSQPLLGRVYGLIVQQATTLAFADASWLLAAVTLVLAPLVLLLRRRAPIVAPVARAAE